MLGGVSDGVGLAPAMRFLVAAILAATLWPAAGPGAGSARADVPVYVGDMGFPAIQDASGPEEYSWKVQMTKDQGLEQVDDQSVRIYYLSDQASALRISAESAHDATGASVPTLSKSLGTMSSL